MRSHGRHQGLRYLTSALVVGLGIAGTAQQQPAQPRPPVFKSSRVLVSVDVVVRDRQGNVVKGLKAEDFEVREDGKPQDVQTFSFQEIAETAATPARKAHIEGHGIDTAPVPAHAAPAHGD